MAAPQYQLRMFYSYSTLEELKIPMIHKGVGCQFDKSELKTSKCPVCSNELKQNDIEEDYQLIKLMDDKIRNQLVFDVNKNQLVRLQKQTYCDPQNNISQIEEVKKLQIQYYNQIYQRQLKKQFKFEDIQQMNEERNQEYVKQIRELKDQNQQIPILFGVLNYKLILFYHQFKLKIELDLFDDSNAKIRQKINSKQLDQILFFENNLYFLYNRNSRSELYFGNIQQVFERQESKFLITPIKQCVSEYTARLIISEIPSTADQRQVQKRMIMLGCSNSWIIENPNSIKEYFKKLPYLQKYSQLDVVNGKQLLVANFQEGQFDKKNDAIAEYYYSDLNDNVESFSKDQLPKLYPFNDYLIFGDRMILYQADQLNQEKIQAQSICYKYSQKDNPTFYLSISIKNNASYLEPIPIVSTRKLIGLISCKLIGLRLNAKDPKNQSDNYLFPALQVYNQQTSTMEIELL